MSSPDSVAGRAAAVETRADGPVAYILLNRPDRLNCFADTMREELADALESVAASDEIRVIVISGAGRAFCTGADMEALAALAEADDHEEFARQVQAGGRVVRRIRELPIPVIAAVNGVASGSGAALAIACDIRLASQDAVIGFGFSRYGLHPDWGATHFLPRLVGTGRATELLLTGRMVSAGEAERIGLFERMAPASTFAEAVDSFAREIAEKPSYPLRLLKRTLFGGTGNTGLDEALRQEAEAQVACFRQGHLRAALARRS
ncbi:MAG TPA: enoyl-CoA hydratase/isomerase family protein [Longimicrobiaceae bacterium]